MSNMTKKLNIPVSQTYAEHLNSKPTSLGLSGILEPTTEYVEQVGPIVIKPIKCYNDFVAILQFRIKSDVLLTEQSAFKNEGIVVGVGPGISAGDGKRCPSQLKIGDVITFFGNSVVKLTPAEGVYKGQTIIIISERNVICGLAPVEFNIVDDK